MHDGRPKLDIAGQGVVLSYAAVANSKWLEVSIPGRRISQASKFWTPIADVHVSVLPTICVFATSKEMLGWLKNSEYSALISV